MTELNENVMEDDTWYQSMMKKLGFVKDLERLQQEREDDLEGKHPHSRVAFTMEGAHYIEEAKRRTNNDVLEEAREVCSQVFEIATLCRDALNTKVGSKLSSVSFKG
jgi:hypothetical protein